MKPLAGLKILDLSQRLPGPLAGMLLAELGAEVIKLENLPTPDPFLDEAMARVDDGFVEWYQQLNSAKKIQRIDFSSSTAKQVVVERLEWADIVLLGLSPRWQKSLQLDLASLQRLARPTAILQLEASQDKGAMHDLNALAEAGLLQLHVAGQTSDTLAPPFLPIAGISFGQQIALHALALHRQAQQEQKPTISRVFLYEEILKVYRPFWTQKLRAENRTKFLHNGKFPCYALYRTKDGNWVAVAAVEAKFWQEFVQLLGLNLTVEDRFSTKAEIFQQVAKTIAVRSTAELDSLLMGKDLCVSLIRS